MKLGPALVSAAIAAMSANAFAFDFGVNTHTAGSATTNSQVASLMQQRNLKSSRLDYWAGMDQTAFRDQVQKIRANGGRAEVSLQNSYQWNYTCPQNFATVEQDSYNQTVTLVNQIKDVVQDFEILNEIQLRPDTKAEVPFNSAGTSTTVYGGKPCYATMVSVVRGMARAIKDVGASSGLPLRSILGSVGRDFGFLGFMQQQGVLFNVVGYHVYPRYAEASLLTDTWYGAGGPLTQLAAYGKPVHINEFDCGEIYDSGYENLAGGTVTETCLKSLTKHLKELKAQTIANLESVHIYEMVDAPSKPAPENRFGMMYDLSNPKVHLYLITAFAGGTLTAAEQYTITSRGLLTDAEISAMKVTSAPAAESPQGSSITTTGTIVDSTGATWTVSGGVVYRNGVATVSSSVTLLLYYNHVVYQQNSYGAWWAWVNSAWQATTDPRTTTSTPPAESPQGTSITTTGTIVDSTGATWTISGGVVYRNGVATVSSSVTLLLYYNHLVYQQNSYGAWWDWVNSAWQATTDPRTTTAAPAPGDTQAPTASISSPGNGSTFPRRSTITANASATDNVGVKEVRFYLNGSLRCASTSAPYSCQLTLPNSRNWTGNLSVQASDAAGNVGSSSISISVN